MSQKALGLVEKSPHQGAKSKSDPQIAAPASRISGTTGGYLALNAPSSPFSVRRRPISHASFRARSHLGCFLTGGAIRRTVPNGCRCSNRSRLCVSGCAPPASSTRTWPIPFSCGRFPGRSDAPDSARSAATCPAVHSGIDRRTQRRGDHRRAHRNALEFEPGDRFEVAVASDGDRLDQRNRRRFRRSSRAAARYGTRRGKAAVLNAAMASVRGG